MQTTPKLKKFSDHSFGKMKENRLSCTICTDNRLVSRTTLTKELGLALKHFPFTIHELKDMLIYGFKRSFFPGPYSEKRKYVRHIIDYLEHIQEKYQLMETEPVEEE